MPIIWVGFMFILGSIIGSFLNVCIYRLPREKSPWNPSRSYCPHCHETIAWYDNIPLVSWFALRGQCRQCGSYISPRYVMVEFLTAVAFALAWWAMNANGERLPVVVVYLALTAALIMASFIDLELRIIPDSITLGGVLLAPLVSILAPQLHAYEKFGRTYMLRPDNVGGPLGACLVGMAVGAGSIWAAGALGKRLFHREAMGFGDVKLMAALGGFLGWQQILLVFFMAPIFGAVVGIIHMLRTKEHHIPYGPFLSIAAYVAMLWGDRIYRAIGL